MTELFINPRRNKGLLWCGEPRREQDGARRIWRTSSHERNGSAVARQPRRAPDHPARARARSKRYGGGSGASTAHCRCLAAGERHWRPQTVAALPGGAFGQAVWPCVAIMHGDSGPRSGLASVARKPQRGGDESQASYAAVVGIYEPHGRLLIVETPASK